MESYLALLLLGFQVILTAVAYVMYREKYKLINIYADDLTKKEQRCEELLNICESMVKEYSEVCEALVDDFKNKTAAIRTNAASPNVEIKSMKQEYIQALKLAEEGMGINEIAKKVKIGRGEVQLLLGFVDKK